MIPISTHRIIYVQIDLQFDWLNRYAMFRFIIYKIECIEPVDVFVLFYLLFSITMTVIVIL